MKNQSGSVFLGLLIIVLCISTLVIVEYIYEEDDMASFYSRAEVESRDMDKDET